ncbi:heterokaryon incompatibility [Paraphoma chrysanthemicola]|nr:heterokaryon incompatibility [Paraphoma chrysanthemicola]
METYLDILKFTALSYTWGDELPEYDILVTSGDHTGWFSVRQNLYDFLQQRVQEHSPLYWIDQICINQNDDDEKGHQVNQMAELYNSATNVEVWLGPGFEGSDRVMDLIARGGQIDYSQQAVPGFRVSRQDQRDLGSAIQDFVDLPYWSRLWIIQEMVLSRSMSICIKDKRLTWTTFYKE